MALATLSIDLVAQLASLQAGMDKAGRIAEKNAAQIEARYQRMSDVATSVGKALGAAISVAGITAFVKATVDGLDRLNDLSDATGASIENLSALEDIAARTGTSMDTVGDAVIKLNKALGDAKPGSPQAQALEAIGLSVKELKAMDPAEALRRVAVALAGYADDGNKARLTQELFGKSLKEVAPLLGDLARSGELVATVTTEQAKQAEAFNQQLSAMQKNLQDLGREAVSPLLEAMMQVSGAFRDSGTEAGELKGVAYALAVPLQALTVLGSDVAFVFRGVGIEVGALAAQAAAVAKLDFASARAIHDMAVKDAADARQRLDEFQRRVMGVNSAVAAASGGFRPSQNYGDTNRPSVRDISGASKAGKSSPFDPFVLKLDDTTAAALKLLENTDTQKIAELKLQLQALIELRGETGAGAIDEVILDIEEALAKLTPEGRAAAAEMERLKSILSQTPTGQMKAVLADVELINRAFARKDPSGPQTPEQWAEAIREAVSKLNGDVQAPLAELSEFAKEASRNIQDALGDSIVKAMEGNASEIGSIWSTMIKRMVAEAAAANLAEALFGAGGLGSGGGWLGMLLGTGPTSTLSAGNLANPIQQVPALDFSVPKIALSDSASTRKTTAAAPSVTYAPTINFNGSTLTPAAVENVLARERSRFAKSYGAA